MTIVNHLSNGTVEVNGKIHKLPNEITSVKGNPDDMLIIKLKYGRGAYTEAFLLGCSILAERKDSDIDVMKKELESIEKESDLLAFKRADLKEKIAAHDEVESTKEIEIDGVFEGIVAEFERLTISAGYHKKQNMINHLVKFSGLNAAKVDEIYKTATPNGSITPDIELVRAAVEKFL